MALQCTKDFPSGDIVSLNREDGASAIIHLFGGTLISWKCKGIEHIFLSSKSLFDNKKAIRGGIPLVFPNFGPWSLGPQHGFARIKQWTVDQQPIKDANGDVTAVLSLSDDQDTRTMWNHKFKVTYTVVLKENALTTRLVIHNLNDKDSFDFTCLFHTYFRVKDIQDVSISGLNGLTFSDKLEDGKEGTETRDIITVDKNYDRVYQQVSGDVKLMSCPEPDRHIEVSLSNLPDIVLWNPWEEKAKGMSDFDDAGYRHMVCVEAGCVSKPHSLPAGSQFQCQQTMTSSKL